MEKTLLTLKVIFECQKERFDEYFIPLLSLAQCGLVGPYAEPQVSLRALQDFQSELVTREGGRIKNNYMKKLGFSAFGLAIIPFSLTLFPPFENGIFSNFFILWSGCMAGVWVSFGIRKPILIFSDLQVLEKDQLDPNIRLIFSGLLTIVLGFMFYKEIIEMKMGAVSTKMISGDPIIAWLIGMFSGLSEQALPSKISKQAEKLLNF